MSWDVPGTVLSPQGALYPWDPHLQRWDPLLGAQGASLAVSGPSQQPTALCGVPSASSGVAQQGAGELCGVGGGAVWAAVVGRNQAGRSFGSPDWVMRVPPGACGLCRGHTGFLGVDSRGCRGPHLAQALERNQGRLSPLGSLHIHHVHPDVGTSPRSVTTNVLVFFKRSLMHS